MDMLLTRINEEEKALEKCGVLQDALRGEEEEEDYSKPKRRRVGLPTFVEPA